MITLILHAHDCQVRYSKLAKWEHSWIRQRAKIHCLKNVDDERTFIYISLKDKKGTNIIREIHSGIITNPNIMAKEFYNHFSNLFNSKDFYLSLPHDIPLRESLSSSYVVEFSVNISNEEILKNLQETHENKSLSPYGLT